MFGGPAVQELLVFCIAPVSRPWKLSLYELSPPPPRCRLKDELLFVQLSRCLFCGSEFCSRKGVMGGAEHS